MVQQLNWQALQVRYEMTTMLPPTADRRAGEVDWKQFSILATALARTNADERHSVREIETMSELADFLNRAGMQSGIAAILKRD